VLVPGLLRTSACCARKAGRPGLLRRRASDSPRPQGERLAESRADRRQCRRRASGSGCPLEERQANCQRPVSGWQAGWRAGWREEQALAQQPADLRRCRRRGSGWGWLLEARRAKRQTPASDWRGRVREAADERPAAPLAFRTPSSGWRGAVAVVEAEAREPGPARHHQTSSSGCQADRRALEALPAEARRPCRTPWSDWQAGLPEECRQLRVFDAWWSSALLRGRSPERRASGGTR